MFNVYVYVKKIRAVEFFRPNFYEKIKIFCVSNKFNYISFPSVVKLANSHLLSTGKSTLFCIYTNFLLKCAIHFCSWTRFWIREINHDRAKTCVAPAD